MKTISIMTTELHNGVSMPLEIPLPPGQRPARRGEFWPGENFTTCNRKWDLRGTFVDHAFVLPALAAVSHRKL